MFPIQMLRLVFVRIKAQQTYFYKRPNGEYSGFCRPRGLCGK